MAAPHLNALDKIALAISPGWALSRLRSRAAALTLARHFEAASGGRRTVGWTRSGADANATNAPALHILRAHARDLVRNNGWAKRGRSVVGNNAVGWGIVPKAKGADGWRTAAAGDLGKRWEEWAETAQCDADGRTNFYGLQRLLMRTIAQDGEVLIRRRRRRVEDGLPFPLQVQVLEPDFLDTAKDGVGDGGGPIIQGVEYDRLGRRVAYWLFDQHPGSGRLALRGGSTFTSKRIPATEILHVFRVDRPGQVRGISWFAPVIVKLKDFDDYDDAALMRAKIAACFSAFVTDVDGTGKTFGEADDSGEQALESMEPGLISYLMPGQEVTFGTPPPVTDYEPFSRAALRKVAAALDITYEDLTADYSNVNFSSGRLAKLTAWSAVHEWRWDMLIPQACSPIWGWVMEAAVQAGTVPAVVGATWTPPPMPMLEPDKEGLAYTRAVRGGLMTPSEVIREQGRDPQSFLDEYQQDLLELDRRGIVLDSDARKVTQAGLTQSAGQGKKAPAEDAPDQT